MSKIKSINGASLKFQSETIDILEDVQCGIVSIEHLRASQTKTLARMLKSDGSISKEDGQKFLLAELDKQRIENEIYDDLTKVCKTLRMASNPDNTASKAMKMLSKQMQMINEFLAGEQ